MSGGKAGSAHGTAWWEIQRGGELLWRNMLALLLHSEVVQPKHIDHPSHHCEELSLQSGKSMVWSVLSRFSSGQTPILICCSFT